jgi:hypothetical protein
MFSPKKGRIAADFPAASFSINQFCQRHHISRAKYFGMRKAGLGPVEMRLGPGTIRITREAELDWQHARENPAGDELAAMEQGKAVLAARGSTAGTAAAASPKHISNKRRRQSQHG